MKEFLIICLCILSANYVTAQYTRCVNPNQRAGLCVHVNECQTLLSVLQQDRLSPSDRQFVKASGCGMASDNRPYVCCTRDTGYTRTRRVTPAFDPFGNFGAGNNFNNYWEETPRSFEPRPWSFGQNDIAQTAPPATRESSPSSDGAALLPQPPSCGGVTIVNKIYGGDDANLNEFPWMVLLEYRRRAGGGLSTNCAGTLINQRYVLTAAHCVTGRIERDIGPLTSVRLGEHDTSSLVDCAYGICAPGAQRLAIEEARAHELYKEKTPNQMHDIALIRLERNVRYADSIRPICLPSVMAPEMRVPGQQYTVAGWGRTLQMARSPVKQKLVVNYMDPVQCKRKFAQRKISIAQTQLCLGGKFAQDSCDGDSGGPLMRFRDNAWVLEGIVSFGYKCGLKDWPGVYTSVAAYDIWIKQNMRL